MLVSLMLSSSSWGPAPLMTGVLAPWARCLKSCLLSFLHSVWVNVERLCGKLQSHRKPVAVWGTEFGSPESPPGPFPSLAEYKESSLFHVIYFLGEQRQFCEKVTSKGKPAGLRPARSQWDGGFRRVRVYLFKPEHLCKRSLASRLPYHKEMAWHPGGAISTCVSMPGGKEGSLSPSALPPSCPFMGSHCLKTDFT